MPKSFLKIYTTLLLFLISISSFAQNETYIKPVSNPLFACPALAGLNKNSTFQMGNHYCQVNEQVGLNMFYSTFDTYSKKLKGGVAFSFMQGLIGHQNISTTEFGFSYTGFPVKLDYGSIRFSASLNYLLASKQWAVFFQDALINSYYSNPGKNFLRHDIFRPKVGALLIYDDYYFGLNMGVDFFSRKNGYALEGDDDVPMSVSLYFTKLKKGRRKGLYSRPFIFTPELIAYYSKHQKFARLNFNSKHTDKTIGVFIQGDFSHEIYAVGGTLGFKTKNSRFTLNAGAGIPELSKETAFFGEASISILVPHIHFRKYRPWAEKK